MFDNLIRRIEFEGDELLVLRLLLHILCLDRFLNYEFNYYRDDLIDPTPTELEPHKLNLWGLGRLSLENLIRRSELKIEESY